LCRYAEVLPPSSREAVRSSAGEGTGWEPSGAQNLDEGRLGEGVDGDTDGTGVGVDGRGSPRRAPAASTRNGHKVR
jgi:hypothetical protein